MLEFLNKNRRKKDNSFIVKLYELHSAAVKKVVMIKLFSKSIGDIEDCVQEVFAIALEKQEQLINHPNIIGWLTVTAKHTALKHNEKYTKIKAVDNIILETIPDALDLCEQVTEDIVFKDLMERGILENVFSELDFEEKRLYNLKWKQNLSYFEIQKTLGISSSAVKNRILRLRQKITSRIKSLSP